MSALQHKRINVCQKGKYWEAKLQSVWTTVPAVEYLSLTLYYMIYIEGVCSEQIY